MSASTIRKLLLVVFLFAWLVTDALFWITGLWWSTGLWPWALLWLAILLVVLWHEWVAILTKSRQTISTWFWQMMEQKPVVGWLIVGLMAVSWVALIGHLVWR